MIHTAKDVTLQIAQDTKVTIKNRSIKSKARKKKVIKHGYLKFNASNFSIEICSKHF